MFVLLGWIMVGNLLGLIVSISLKKFVSENVMQSYVGVLTEILKYLPVMIYVYRKSQHNRLTETGYRVNSSHFSPFKGWQIALITVVLALAYMLSADLLNYWNFKLTMLMPGMQTFSDLIKEAFNEAGSGPFWSNLLVTAILAAIFEEWLYRGIVLRGLLAKMSPVWAIVISALFFAFIHMNP
ncbi:MAG: CPBP family intramembrane metalloprotease [Bacteroidaceae bacterium]|nr:CPBP family intramembrane metalloprotease [Bacteroidaceae bacterium]